MTKRKLPIHTIVLCSLFAALIAVGAFIRIPVPVVPFTLQVLFTGLAGLLLGSKRGALSVIIYVVIGLIGVPVFTQGGGPAYVLQPTFGYILGFIIGTYVTGRIAEKSATPSLKRLLAASFAGLAIVYIMGMIYYYFIANYYAGTPIGVGALFVYCFLLCVPGDVLLCFAGSVLAKRLIPILRKQEGHRYGSTTC